jgi:SagB-type dehydrogenase family enzyme
VIAVPDYHQNTKHSFHRFARSLGYLDWAAQPDPFRRYDGAPRIALPRTTLRPDLPYSSLFNGAATPAPIDLASIGEFLRCSMGLSAWKQYQKSRWALRVNPSSGNLHPTEAYVVWNGQVCHYAPREHELEVRAELPSTPPPSRGDTFIVGLTSVLWREAWKYGERAFRYCQHDIGHAIGAMRLAAAMLGWGLTVLDECSHAEIAGLLGVDRDEDYGEAEREEPECLIRVTTRGAAIDAGIDALMVAARAGTWSGHANVLSRSRVAWPAIDDVAVATRKAAGARRQGAPVRVSVIEEPVCQEGEPNARQVILQRRSALGFDASSSLPRDRLLSMLRRLQPGAAPWDALDWLPQVHLALFVHRVEGLPPGLYMYLRDPGALAGLRAAMNPDFLWENLSNPSNPSNPSNLSNLSNDLFLLVPTDVRFAASRLSCDQDIASDGFFSLGMIARFEDALREHGDCFYRRLFWEAGLIGQVLYLEAEAAGARATGIGCFYDDPVHEVLGLTGMAWQSVYHFSMGVPVDEGRLTSEPGYPGGW